MNTNQKTPAPAVVCDALVLQWRERAAKERLRAKRNPGSTESLKAVATGLAYESAATELECLLSNTSVSHEAGNET
jgi:hypothetical protein